MSLSFLICLSMPDQPHPNTIDPLVQSRMNSGEPPLELILTNVGSQLKLKLLGFFFCMLQRKFNFY